MANLLDFYQQRGTLRRLGDLYDQIQPVLHTIARELACERVFVAFVNSESGTFEGSIGDNIPGDVHETGAADVEGAGPWLEALRLQRPLRIDDAARDPRVPEAQRPYYLRYGLLAFAAVPLPPASAVLVVGGGTPLTDAQMRDLLRHAGRIVGLVAEQAEANRLLETGEQRAIESEWLWWMLNAVQDPIVLSDEQNRIILQNAQAERLLRSRADDSVGRRGAIDLNHFLLTAALSSFVLDQGASLGRELTLVDPTEGEELLFEVICRPATNLRTGAKGLISVLKDVTDLRRAGEELGRSLTELQRATESARQERDRLNLILGNVADPIVVTDPAGEILLMNQPAERLLQPPTGASSQGAAAVYLANDAKLSSFLAQLRLEATAARRDEIQLTDPATDKLMAISVTATEVRDELGQVTAVVSVLHDLTTVRELERRQVEQELFESQKMAAVGRLAAALAHEINNPLEAIKNSLYLLVSHAPVDDPNRQFLEIANKETARVSGIIRQMLGFYRPTLLKALVEVNAVIDEAVTLLDKPLRQAHIAVRCELDWRLPSVLASEDQLKQVFLNLLLNAQEAMPEGGSLRITTRLPRDTDSEFLLSGPSVIVQFQDTGAGISEENLRHIFEPFFSTKAKQRGTGLGLWVSLGIIQQHGGQMKVRSRVGRGTTFTIALPLTG